MVTATDSDACDLVQPHTCDVAVEPRVHVKTILMTTTLSQYRKLRVGVGEECSYALVSALTKGCVDIADLDESSHVTAPAAFAGTEQGSMVMKPAKSNVCHEFHQLKYFGGVRPYVIINVRAHCFTVEW